MIWVSTEWAFRLENYLYISLVLGTANPTRLFLRKNTNMAPRIRPESTIPICLDLGTNTQRYLDDPFYLGLRICRVQDKEMEEFMDEFVHEMTATFPKLVIQFEVTLYPF